MRENCTLKCGVNHPQQPAALHTMNRFDFFNLVGILFFFFFFFDSNSGRTNCVANVRFRDRGYVSTAFFFLFSFLRTVSIAFCSPV